VRGDGGEEQGVCETGYPLRKLQIFHFSTHTHAGGESEVAPSKGCVEIQESREISEKAQKGNLL